MTSEERREGRYLRRCAKRLAKKSLRNRQYDNFDKVFTYEHLFRSYLKCRKNVRWKASVQGYIANAPLRVYESYKALHDGTFKSDGFYEFDLFERGKKRHIRSVTMNERVVQRCLCDYSLVPIVSRTFIYDNGASIKDKGYTFAVNRIERHLRWHFRHYGSRGYILLFDFSGYFDSVSHELIGKILHREYTDERLIALVEHFVDMFGERGLGLGSQISQILALSAANGLDHYIKEVLGIRCYGRYMDDGYLIHPDKAYLTECIQRIAEKCNELGLTLNLKKTGIVPLTRDFCYLKIKYRMTDTGYLVKRVWRKSIVRMRRKLKKLKRKYDNGAIGDSDIQISYNSWLSHLHGLNVYRTRRSIERLLFALFTISNNKTITNKGKR